MLPGFLQPSGHVSSCTLSAATLGRPTPPPAHACMANVEHVIGGPDRENRARRRSRRLHRQDPACGCAASPVRERLLRVGVPLPGVNGSFKEFAGDSGAAISKKPKIEPIGALPFSGMLNHDPKCTDPEAQDHYTWKFRDLTRDSFWQCFMP